MGGFEGEENVFELWAGNEVGFLLVVVEDFGGDF